MSDGCLQGGEGGVLGWERDFEVGRLKKILTFYTSMPTWGPPSWGCPRRPCRCRSGDLPNLQRTVDCLAYMMAKGGNRQN